MTKLSSRPTSSDEAWGQVTPATRLRQKHLLGIADLSPEEILLVLDTAEAMQEIARRPIKKVPTLRGRTVVNLFFEPSTRTRTSFEVAEKRVTDSLMPLYPALEQTMDQLEALYDRDGDIVGVATGYHDLDGILLGLQPSTLSIVAARS